MKGAIFNNADIGSGSLNFYQNYHLFYNDEYLSDDRKSLVEYGIIENESVIRLHIRDTPFAITASNSSIINVNESAQATNFDNDTYLEYLVLDFGINIECDEQKDVRCFKTRCNTICSIDNSSLNQVPYIQISAPKCGKQGNKPATKPNTKPNADGE